MKKLFFILFSIIVATSCVTIPYVEEVYFLDYSFFRERNFFVTESASVSFDYSAVGSILVVISSGQKIQEKEVSTGNEPGRSNDLYSVRNSQSGASFNTKKFKVATIEDAFGLLYEKALSVGADGILNLATTKEGSEITVSGMLIKQ